MDVTPGHYERNVCKRVEALRARTIDYMKLTRAGTGLNISIGFRIDEGTARRVCALLDRPYSAVFDLDDREIEKVVANAHALGVCAALAGALTVDP